MNRVRADFATPAMADEYRAIQAAFERPPQPGLAFDPAHHDPLLVARARAQWAGAADVEYSSTSTFMAIAANLRALGDPVDVQAVALRMAQDELRHAMICCRVVRAMGGDPAFVQPNENDVAPHPDCGLEENTLRSVIFSCCLSETVNAARLSKSYAETTDPFVRDAYRSLLADERLGMPDLTELSASYQETIANATVPALESFGIAAEQAWRTRSATA